MTNQWIALGFRLAAATNMVGVLSNVLEQKSSVMGELLLQQHMATAFVAGDYVWFSIAVHVRQRPRFRPKSYQSPAASTMFRPLSGAQSIAQTTNSRRISINKTLTIFWFSPRRSID